MAALGGNTIGGLSPGTEVEVRTRFQGRWSSGFEVDAVHSDQKGHSERYVVRRRSTTHFGTSRGARGDNGCEKPVTGCSRVAVTGVEHRSSGPS